MTEEDFRSYLAAFNARDFAGFSKYYADDVEFILGDRKRIVGAQAIVDFYKRVFDHIDEALEVVDMIVAPDGAALRRALIAALKPLRDAPPPRVWRL